VTAQWMNRNPNNIEMTYREYAGFMLPNATYRHDDPVNCPSKLDDSSIPCGGYAKRTRMAGKKAQELDFHRGEAGAWFLNPPSSNK